LSGTALRRGNNGVRVVSALWGVLSPADRIPAYRLSMNTTLPGIGPLARYWRDHLGTELRSPGGDVVIDCRSSAYQAAWHPPAATACLTGLGVQSRQDGRRAVLSHHAKHTRGLLTHHLLTRPSAPPRTVAATVAAAREMVGSLLREVNHLPAARGADQLEL